MGCVSQAMGRFDGIAFCQRDVSLNVPPVHHCLLWHLCIKYQGLWQGRVRVCSLGRIGEKLSALSSVLTLHKPEQSGKQGEAVMEKLLIFPRCKSTMGVFEYCIKTCWHTDKGNLLYLHGHAPTNKCCKMQKHTQAWAHFYSHTHQIMRLTLWCLWKVGGLGEWEGKMRIKAGTPFGIELMQQWWHILGQGTL